MTFLLQNSDLISVARIYGPLGLITLAVILLTWKGLLPYIKKQHEEHVAALETAKKEQVTALEKVVDDARKERDYSRLLREKEVDKFIDSLKLRDEKMERGFDEIIRALQETRRK